MASTCSVKTKLSYRRKWGFKGEHEYPKICKEMQAKAPWGVAPSTPNLKAKFQRSKEAIKINLQRAGPRLKDAKE